MNKNFAECKFCCNFAGLIKTEVKNVRVFN